VWVPFKMNPRLNFWLLTKFDISFTSYLLIEPSRSLSELFILILMHQRCLFSLLLLWCIFQALIHSPEFNSWLKSYLLHSITNLHYPSSIVWVCRWCMHCQFEFKVQGLNFSSFAWFCLLDSIAPTQHLIAAPFFIYSVA
jgi:hypothetical protein